MDAALAAKIGSLEKRVARAAKETTWNAKCGFYFSDPLNGGRSKIVLDVACSKYGFPHGN